MKKIKEAWVCEILFRDDHEVEIRLFRSEALATEYAARFACALVCTNKHDYHILARLVRVKQYERAIREFNDMDSHMCGVCVYRAAVSDSLRG